MDEDLILLRDAIHARKRELRGRLDDPHLKALEEQFHTRWRQRQEEARAAVPPPPLPEHPVSPAIAELIHAFHEFARACPYGRIPPLKASAEGCRILALDVADRIDVVVHCYLLVCENRDDIIISAPARIFSGLFHPELEFGEKNLITLIVAAWYRAYHAMHYIPSQAILSTTARHVGTHQLSPGLREALLGLRSQLQSTHRNSVYARGTFAEIDDILAENVKPAPDCASAFTPGFDAWSMALKPWLATLPKDIGARISSFLVLAAAGGGGAKPGKSWLKLARETVEQDQKAEVGPLLLDILNLHEPNRQLEFYSQITLRGLIWLIALAAPPGVARRLESYALECLTYSSARGAYLAQSLGNAAVLAFSLMPANEGAESLARLRLRLKRPGETKLIEKALAALATASGSTPAELEEIGLPDFGLVKGTRKIAVGPATAILTLTQAGELETTWRDADGSIGEAPPAVVKKQHKDGLKALRSIVKEIDDMLRAQRLRLERLYLAERAWPVDVWRARYLDERLVAGFARRLIWSFEIEGAWIPLLPRDTGFVDASGTPRKIPRKARVRLWHPMHAQPDDVIAWRKFLQVLGVTQPFKQAYREIYVLTDAERGTDIYSNRFAAHIVDQNRLRALAMTRGWKCPAFGYWNSDSVPMKELPERNIQIEFAVRWDPRAFDDQFQSKYLWTDSIRFMNPNRDPVRLADVHPVLFSELMRDVDLFVGVASVGNDPYWTDLTEGEIADIWTPAAFGALSETGKTRHIVLKDLLPTLAIASRCRLDDRWLVVEGRIRTYRIHLGSGNIQMEPNSEYLCIVPDRRIAGNEVRLPFEGDTMLSLVLSKAFLLVDDDKIKDASIRGQIGRGLSEPTG